MPLNRLNRVRRGMLAVAGVLWVAVSLQGQEPGEVVTRSSLSQQFVVSGIPLNKRPLIPLNPGSGFIHLEPNTAAISCERIKDGLLRLLGIQDTWRGKIYLRLHVRRQDEERVMIQGTDYARGGTYWIDSPDQVSRRRFLDTLVSVLLLEMANRGTKELPAELPRWLPEGISAQLESQGILSMLADPFTDRVEIHRPTAAMMSLRALFLERPALTLNELNWPGASPTPEQEAHYRASAHLMVSELLRLPDGRRTMWEMISVLHRSLNWQTGFHAVYASRFPTVLEFEKWWTVTVAHFIGREVGTELPGSEALQQLGVILRIPITVELDGDVIPQGVESSLQRIIQEWEPARLDPVLSRKLSQLQGLQWRSPEPYATLTSGYREALNAYLATRTAAGGSSGPKGQLLPNARVAQRKVLQQLNQLDRERNRLEAQEAALGQSRSKKHRLPPTPPPPPAP